ncbi:TPA: homocysteine S-methyltransferase family protein [Candidatus Woesearchaeota archaeon]|nr:homocysteine S-methyltransferase family protein [Candidatus Woesearchaeota archaeon]
MNNTLLRRIFEEEPVIMGNGCTGVYVAKKIIPEKFKGQALTDREGSADGFECRAPYWSFELNMFPQGQIAVRQAHKDYLDATTDLFWTIMSMNVFRGNRRILTNGHIASRLEELNRIAAHNLEHVVLESGRRNILKVATIGPGGDCYDASSCSSRESASKMHYDQLKCLQPFADYFQFETFPSVEELKGALDALRRVNAEYQKLGLEPKLAAINFVLNKNQEDKEDYGKVLDGSHPGAAIEGILKEYQDLILYAGFNCTPQHAVIEGLRKVRTYDKRLLSIIKDVHINPTDTDPSKRHSIHGIDSIASTELIQFYETLREEFPAVKILWGCCGVLPEQIKALHDHYAGKAEYKGRVALK